MVVDAGSAKKADDLLALLRKSIGTLPVVPVALKNPPEITMTEWLNEGNLPASFTLEDEAELRSAMEHGGIIRCKQQDLMTDGSRTTWPTTSWSPSWPSTGAKP